MNQNTFRFYIENEEEKNENEEKGARFHDDPHHHIHPLHHQYPHTPAQRIESLPFGVSCTLHIHAHQYGAFSLARRPVLRDPEETFYSRGSGEIITGPIS